jgi:hypothetical protein
MSGNEYRVLKTGLGLACLALGLMLPPCAPMLLAQGADAAPAAPSPTAPAEVSPAASASPVAAAPEDSAPPITVQLEPPPISISSSMIGVAGPLGAKAAEGKPIFAEFVTEHHQDFADGNSITRTTSSTIYRDAKGRIRRESQLSLPGLPAGVASATFITIVDRRLGCGWVLNPQEMIAHRYPLGGQPSYVAHVNAQGGGHLFSRGARPMAGHGMDASGSRHWYPHAFPPSVHLSQNSVSPAAMSAASTDAIAAAPGAPGKSEVGSPAMQAAGARADEAGMAGAAPSMRLDQTFLAAPNPVRTENLGEEMILGFRAHGKRVITTLPPGEIGNDRSIDIVSEQWFSPELELVMRSMHRDPWGGEFTTMVVRIRQGEQPARLFAVPSKYKVIDAESEGLHHVIETEGSRGSGSAPW